MSDTENGQRRRIAVVLVLIGCGLILAGAALVIQQRYTTRAEQEALTTGASESKADLVAQIQQLTFALTLIVVIFGVGILAFRRWSRHYRQWLLRPPRPPTPAEDLWAMHRTPSPEVPENDTDEDDEDDDQDDSDDGHDGGPER